MTRPSCMTQPATKPGLLELALTFNKISLASFGGGLSLGASGDRRGKEMAR